jgi:hypothetical protein
MSLRTIERIEGTSPMLKPRVVRITYDREFAEYRCMVTDDRQRRPAVDYYTPDKADAIATARAMCGLRAVD